MKNKSKWLTGLIIGVVALVLLAVIVSTPEGFLGVEDETSSVQKVGSSEKEAEEESKKLAQVESIEEESKKESVQESLDKEAEEKKESKRKEEKESKRKADEESKKELEPLTTNFIAEGKKAVLEEPKEYKREDYNPEITYDNLARYPDEYFFVPVTFEGKIVQVIHGDDSTQYRMAANGDYDQIFFLEISNSSLDERVLEDDYVRFYGNFMGDIKYETVLGSSRTIPGVIVEKFEFQ